MVCEAAEVPCYSATWFGVLWKTEMFYVFLDKYIKTRENV